MNQVFSGKGERVAEFAIQAEKLIKTYGRGKRQVKAVNSLSLQVETGQIYGFLGPNGAGKTTTIRMLLDLVRPTAGHALIFGQPVRAGTILRKRVGALVEGATFYPFLTGRANLDVLARTSGWHDAKRIQHALAEVGLADRADRPVKGYSTGMKQRLGVAAALLNNPDLIILDEPANGLDPNGIQEMRVLFRQLVDERGKTIFFSSHILSEVEQLCERVAIVNQGEIVREGKVDDLLGAQNEVRIDAQPLERARTLLTPRWTVLGEEDQWLRVQATRDDLPQMIDLLRAGDVTVFQIVQHRQSLEDLFLAVTGETIKHA
jgi:ABC-2 type transport system ATP-binding protein